MPDDKDKDEMNNDTDILEELKKVNERLEYLEACARDRRNRERIARQEREAKADNDSCWSWEGR